MANTGQEEKCEMIGCYIQERTFLQLAVINSLVYFAFNFRYWWSKLLTCQIENQIFCDHMSRLCFTEVILLTCVTEPFFFAEQTISTDDCGRHKHPVITESTGHYQCNYRGRMFSNNGGIGIGEGSPKNPHQLPVVCVFSRVQLFETPWTVACQAPPSMEFSRQEYWSRLPFPSAVDLPNIGTEPVSPKSPTLAGGSFTTEPPGKSQTLPRQCLNFQVWRAQYQLKIGAVT